MYVRVVKSRQRGKVYRSVQICESYRDKSKSKYPLTRVIAHLGQLDAFTEKDVDGIINGLCKVFGRESAKDVMVEKGRDFGHIYALLRIWKDLKIGRVLTERARAGGHRFDMEAHIRLMVLNRLCDPCSKLALLDWIHGVYVPGMDPKEVAYHHLLRAMDWLIEHKQWIEKEVANELLRVFDQELDLVFYDVTSSVKVKTLSDTVR